MDFFERAFALAAGVHHAERSVADDLATHYRSRKRRLLQEHRVAILADHVMESSRKLTRLYTEQAEERKAEAEELGGADHFNKFYKQLRELRELQRADPSGGGATGPEWSNPAQHLTEATPESALGFSGEEAWGRYLDLHSFYQTAVNIGVFPQVKTYGQFLGLLEKLGEVPRTAKNRPEYRELIEGLYEYLCAFARRCQPLVDFDALQRGDRDAFAAAWEARTVPGWTDIDPPQVDAAALFAANFESAKELEEVGLDKLKEELAKLGLKVGGTAAQRAERLFLTKTTPLAQIDAKHFAKGRAPPKSDAERERRLARYADLAWIEFGMQQMLGRLSEAVKGTLEQIDKKQSWTFAELRAERREMEQADDELDMDEGDDDDDEELTPQERNLKNLPLGWDGKPIPVWLYKLHGLAVEFKCEICGDEVYKGPRAFERHFQDWRHTYGMKCLGIPNTPEFQYITAIEDARALWARIQKEKKTKEWRPEADEEIEDADGNVYSRRTYEDLRAQGLL